MFAQKGNNGKVLSAIPAVALIESNPGCPMKFVLAKLVHGEEERLVIRGNNHVVGTPTHKLLKEELDYIIRRDLKIEPNVEILGGGWILVVHEPINIWLWGGSVYYGAPDYKVVKTILEEKYADYRVLIVNDLLPEYPQLRQLFSIIERQSAAGVYPAARMAQIRRVLAKAPKNGVPGARA